MAAKQSSVWADLRESRRKTISPIGSGNSTKLSLFPIKSACFEPAYSTYITGISGRPRAAAFRFRANEQVVSLPAIGRRETLRLITALGNAPLERAPCYNTSPTLPRALLIEPCVRHLAINARSCHKWAQGRA
jgi:hypothetical protein